MGDEKTPCLQVDRRFYKSVANPDYSAHSYAVGKNMSGTMFKNFKMLIITAALFTLWVAPGSAFQLFGGETDMQPEIANPLTQLESSPSGPTLDLGDGEAIESGKSESMNIWIPGLGVVGQMPKLDFGLEMLYGAQDTPKETPNTSQELEEFESDFAIKGTIKRKF